MLINLKYNFKITTSQIVDKYISAEIPDPCENHSLHDIIIRHMIHGLCGDWWMEDVQNIILNRTLKRPKWMKMLSSK